VAASYQGHTAIVQALIRAWPDLNLKDKFGWTALMTASNAGHTGTVQALLGAGADRNIRHDKVADAQIPVLYYNYTAKTLVLW
jgi:ankyrin repeat protein